MLSFVESDHICYVLSVAARQEAKVKKLETENEKMAESSLTKPALSDNAEDGSSSVLTSVEDNKPEFSYKLPPALEGISNLPPSVLPPSADAFVGQLPEWG